MVSFISIKRWLTRNSSPICLFGFFHAIHVSSIVSALVMMTIKMTITWFVWIGMRIKSPWQTITWFLVQIVFLPFSLPFVYMCLLCSPHWIYVNCHIDFYPTNACSMYALSLPSFPFFFSPVYFVCDRKTCLACKCPRETHAIYQEQLTSVKERLGFKPSTNISTLDAKQSGYTWIPPGIMTANKVFAR